MVESEQSFYSSIRHLNLSDTWLRSATTPILAYPQMKTRCFRSNWGLCYLSRIPESQVAEFVDNARRRAVAAFREHPVTGFQLLHEYFVRDRFRLLFDDDWL